MTGTAKSKKIAANTLYTIGGALVLNGVLQLLVYPRMAAVLGAEKNGTVLYLMAFVNILGPSIGQALNNSRLVLRRDMDVSNGDYNTVIVLFSMIGIAATLILTRGVLETPAAWILTAVLIFFTNFRYYGDVEYRLSLNYRRYFIYYSVCGVGYALGFVIYRLTGSWYAIFLTGEACALLYVGVTGSIFRKAAVHSEYFAPVFRKGSLLVLSYFVTNLSLNIDRLYLKNALSGEAVTTYYVVSLIGKTLVLFLAPVNTIIISYLTKENTRLRRRSFLKFAGIGLFASAFFFVCCEIATPIFIRIFYPDLVSGTTGLVTVVTISQILAMLSAYLFIIVLTFTGERWQLGLQCAHLVLTLVLVSIMTPGNGLYGFSLAVLIANTLRVAAVLLLGVMKSGEGE